MTEQNNAPSADEKTETAADMLQRTKGRNLAIALSLAGFVLLIFIITIVRLGPGILDRPL